MSQPAKKQDTSARLTAVTCIAAAFIATFWGVFLANGIMLPLANKLKRMSTEEVQGREMVMEGIIAIAEGENPRNIETKLQGYLNESETQPGGEQEAGE